MDMFLLECLSHEQHNKVEQHLTDCADCQMLLASMKREHDEWQGTPMPASLVSRIEAEAQSRSVATPTFWEQSQAWMRSFMWMPVGAAAMLCLLWFGSSRELTPNPLQHLAPVPNTQTMLHGRRKGMAPTFSVYLFRNKNSRLVPSSAQFHGGDLLGFRYKGKGYRHLFVILLDSKQEISWLYPSQATQSIAIQPEGKLPGSVELDHAKGEERLLAFFSALPLQASEVKQLLPKALLQREGLLSLPHQPAQQIHLTTFLLKKK
jgi:hypothetical protein